MNQSPRWERIETHIDGIAELAKLNDISDVMAATDPAVLREIFGSYSLTFMLLELLQVADRKDVVSWADSYMITGKLPRFKKSS
jgi:hypothetical protein